MSTRHYSIVLYCIVCAAPTGLLAFVTFTWLTVCASYTYYSCLEGALIEDEKRCGSKQKVVSGHGGRFSRSGCPGCCHSLACTCHFAELAEKLHARRFAESRMYVIAE